MTLTHWVVRQNKLETPKEKDEVNKREVYECDGRARDPDAMVAPPSPTDTQADTQSRRPRQLVFAPPPFFLLFFHFFYFHAMVRFAERRVFQSRHGALCSKTRRDFVQRAEKWESRKNKGQLIHKGGRHEGFGKHTSGSCPHGMPSALLKMCKVGKLMLVLVMMANCDYAAGLSASQIMSSVPVHAFLGGSNFKNRQHLYFVNVSALVDDNPNLPNFMAPQRLSVKLEQDGPTYGRLRPLVLSLCHEQLPCGDLGCSCPAKFVDDGSRGLSAGDSLNSVRSVDVNPCDLKSGIWYVSVDFANGKMGVGAAMDEPSVGYTLTAMLQSALIRAGEASEDVLCCMQSQYFVLLVTQLMKGNELRIKLLSDDRLHNQSPLRLSMSYEVLKYVTLGTKISNFGY